MNNDGLVLIEAGALHHKETPKSAVEMVEMHSFAIGRHLVTVEQYAAFIDEGGYEDVSLWSSDGWAWKLDHDAEAPRFWGEDEWAAYLEPTFPVIGVTAYEAEAFAAQRQLRLPSENEWERACRGDDARDFPWGDVWEDDRCGHRDYGTRCTKAIGSYPQSVSPLGIHDLVGNVWQWTSDVHGDVWAVRGGAWNNLPWSIGSAGRNGYKPAAQFSNLGFRVAGEPSDL
jgi:formylglycine-generating enzyme required for sulfatase activity